MCIFCARTDTSLYSSMRENMRCLNILNPEIDTTVHSCSFKSSFLGVRVCVCVLQVKAELLKLMEAGIIKKCQEGAVKMALF